MLLQLKETLRTRPSASVWELTKTLNVAADVVQAMLAHWMRKGCVRLCEIPPGCADKCAKCGTAALKRYEWIG